MTDVDFESSSKDLDDDPVVLVVDDEDDIRQTFRIYLQDEYEVREAAEGSEALMELGPEVDVMLLDRRMPGMSGDEVLEQLDDIFLDCHVIMATAVDPEFAIADMPIHDYLTKPVTKAELQATVEQLLMLDQYEELLGEYFAITRKYGTLKSNHSQEELDSDADFQYLDQRRSEIHDKIDAILTAFPDEEIADAFREIHSAP